MILTIDIGNTNIVFGLYQNRKLSHKWRMISDVNKSIDDYSVDIIELFLTNKIDIKNLSGAIIASVVPNLSEKIYLAIKNFFQGKILLIGKNAEINIDVKLKNKEEVGADRLLNAYGGYHYFGGNLIIIDFGTATTFDIIDKNGAYIGGVISPGINLSLQALKNSTAKLPKIEITKQKNIIGTNTVEAMNSGVYFGYISLIEGVITRIENELGHKMTKIITGGLAPIFIDEIEIQHHSENLTLDALNLMYHNN